MNNLLLYLGGLLVVVFAALAGVPYAIDWNSYRGIIEEEASRMLGREVRVQGNVSLRLLPSPYFHAEQLRIGSAVGEETGRPLFQADGFTVWLSIPPLLKGVVEARKVDVLKPVLELNVDADGRTSLAALSVLPGRLTVLPNDVTFRSVTIVDGSLGLTGPKGVELARLDAINGEVSTDTIDGPYRYRGTVVWEGQPREVRFNSAARDPNGDLRFKTIVTVEATGNSYTLEGTVSNLLDVARIDGNLSARISATGFEVKDSGSRETAPGAAPVTPAFFDVTSKVASEPGRINLDNIAISLEQGGLPQLISGRSSIAWKDQVKLDMELTSKWLDLDRLTAGGTEASRAIPLELARTLFDRLVEELPAVAQTDIAFTVDQVGLGRQAVSGFKLKASRSGGPLELKDVRANLPGGTHLSLDGVVDGQTGARGFTGTMALSGQSLNRFTTWGFGDNPFSRSRSDGPFALAGNLRLNDTAIELTEASAEVSGTPVIGAIKLGLSETRRLAVALEGDKIDLDDLWPGNPGLRGLRGLLTGEGKAPATDTEQAGAVAAADLFGSDVSFDIKAGELIDGDQKLQNVHLDVALQKGALTVPKLKFESNGGLAVDLEGAAADVPDKTRGRLRGVIEAPSQESVATLTELVDLPPELSSALERWLRLTPWRVATTFSFGERTPAAVDVAIDGTLRGGRIVAETRVDGAREAWRAAPADITVQIDTPDVYGFMDQISGTSSKGSSTAPGKVFVKAAGKASEGLVAVAELDAETVELEFNGRVAVPDSGGMTAKGEIRVDAEDMAPVMRLAGLGLGSGVGRVPLSGTVATAHDGSKLTLASPSLKIGESVVSGVLTYVAETDGGKAVVDADLSADKASLPTLLTAWTAGQPQAAAPVVDPPTATPRRREAETPDAATVPAVPAPIWPDQPFDFSAFDDVTGTLKAAVRSLTLDPRIAMKDARFEVALEPGKLDVKRLEGAVLGGKAVSAFTFLKEQAGASLNGKLDISISKTGSSESDGDDAITGDVAALDVAFSGRALSLAAMMSILTGKGTLNLGDVTLSGVAPKAVADIADQALEGKALRQGEQLKTDIRTMLKSTRLKLGKVTIPVTVADGQLSLSRVQVETNEGRATFDTQLDLATLVFDSTWKIEGKALTRAQPSVPGAAAPDAAAAGVPQPVPVTRSLLPAVDVVYAGSLADLAAIEPRIETDALERELAVRRMERDVDELERLRKLDEQQAAKERARQQALEAERQKNSGPNPNPVPEAAPEGAVEQAPVPVDGAASFDPEAAAKAAAEAAVDAETDPEPGPKRVQAQPRKKPPPSSWQPFQISPYQ